MDKSKKSKKGVSLALFPIPTYLRTTPTITVFPRRDIGISTKSRHPFCQPPGQKKPLGAFRSGLGSAGLAANEGAGSLVRQRRFAITSTTPAKITPIPTIS